ncbi:AAA family ATPase [Rhodococcus sp. 06-470-2]|nr:AAA family ATPase [Rhodococcus sp. 06-470-2]OZE70936.1 AAA family ATPase [Rhodococcus sp. 05-2221-1B]
MTPFEIQRLDFTTASIVDWTPPNPRYRNWPVVYVIDGDALPGRGELLRNVYVGETLNAVSRMRQHLENSEKRQLSSVRIILDDKFNKSVCLDLESYLIRLLAGDGTFRVLNRNSGVVESDYFERDSYRTSFKDVFQSLRDDGMFTRSIAEIENSDLFKLSPFKALTHDQAVAVEGIVEGLLEDLESPKSNSMSVVQGSPGTGKTVVAIYLLKLLMDIAFSRPEDIVGNNSIFSEFFVDENRERLSQVKIGLVVPQQSLRTSIQRVFGKTPGLRPDMVLTPFDVGKAKGSYDVLIVDEAHRLNQRANQPSGGQNKLFSEINIALFGSDDPAKTQLDWIKAKSDHQLLLVDGAQRVRPADLPLARLQALTIDAEKDMRLYKLMSQMRVRAGEDYVSYVRRILGAETNLKQLRPESFADYDFQLFDSLSTMREEIHKRDAEVGLARLVAGYAWKWKSKRDKAAWDIELDGEQLRWNGKQVDWIASPGSLAEVGSIHTVQGYDLNYAGVIVGADLRYEQGRGLFIDRDSYFDSKGKENNAKLGIEYSDDDLLQFITNIYAVLLTRGMLGTYVYVVDSGLREYLARFIPPHSHE